MSLQCEVCSRKFPTNASLYIHKQTQHNKPTLLIMNHDHNEKKKRSNNSDRPSSKKLKIDPQNDDGLEIVDEFNDNDEDVEYESVDEYVDDSQDDDKLEVVDEVEDDGQDDKDLDRTNEVEDDGQDDQNLIITDRFDRPNNRKKKIDYKILYENCTKRSNKLKAKIKRMARSYKNLQNDRIKIQRDFNEKMTKLKKVHEKQMNDLETLKDVECKDKIDEYQHKFQDKITEMEINHKKAINDLESECEDKIKKLTDHINSLQDDETSFNSLTDAIFNCTTMEEIFEIQNLIKNHQIDIVIERHLKTLQNIFLSLSFGILPICQPQRKKVTDKQRSIVEKIQSSSGNTAKRLIKSNREDVTNLFSIINDSLKLARNSYNKYGTDVGNDSI